ncbi:MAG: UvrD-helicase domain-containing protein [Deltaproteobacteria bacterium]|nr:UvrD-helicase domain-containing protein [Deltaproteobacteria bacterium]
MFTIADLHIHSRYSMATSKKLDFIELYKGALEKGITLLGTGDFTHPGWMEEIENQLVDEKNGFFSLKPELKKSIENSVPGALNGDVKFVLQVEISNIYKQDDRVRKNHNLIYAPSIEAAKKINEKLSKIGNIKSDGRPILGLSARDLLEITLESDPLSFLIPAHIWTPWFSMLGSKSGFDSPEHCFKDLYKYIFAVETGLSSDPPMNWLLSALDHLTLVSNSDAHSPKNLGREATLLDIDNSFESLLHALKTKEGYLGTIEFFPEEGKYFLDGHRNCNICLTPKETKLADGICPVCKKPVTQGVLNRVTELADRDEIIPENVKFDFNSIVPINEIVAQTLGVKSGTKKVESIVNLLRRSVGSDFFTILHAPLEDIEKVAGAVAKEAFKRVREGDIEVSGGYDGEFGTVKIFKDDEISMIKGQMGFWAVPSVDKPLKKRSTVAKLKSSTPKAIENIDLFTHFSQKNESIADRQKIIKEYMENPLAGLNSSQKIVAQSVEGPLHVNSGPGTGKTKTLVARISNLIKCSDILPKNILAITFTNQAAKELKERLQHSVKNNFDQLTVTTFHGFGKMLLEEFYSVENFKIIDNEQQIEIAEKIMGLNTPGSTIKKMLNHVSHIKQSTAGCNKTNSTEEEIDFFLSYEQALKSSNSFDVDDLVQKAWKMINDNHEMSDFISKRYKSISVDEYQDINEVQSALIKLIAKDGRNLMVIGDIDQAIYSFRGASPQLFSSFSSLYKNVKSVELNTSYRLTDKVAEIASKIINSPQSDKSINTVKQGIKVELTPCPTSKSEAEQIVIRIERLIGGSSNFSMDSGRVTRDEGGEFTFGEIGILTRTKAQFKDIVEALERSSIPYEQIGEDDYHDPRGERVALMTMHASKGREFEAVFITGVEDGIIPLEIEGKPANIDEERRLLYVAVTRAKTVLMLSYSKKRMLYGKTLSGNLSNLISKIDTKEFTEGTVTLPAAKPKQNQLPLL